MKFRLFAPIAMIVGLMLPVTAADSSDAAAKKEALQELGDFIGTWKANGRGTFDGRRTLWKETIEWGWKFKDGVPSLGAEITDGRFFTGGVMSYDPEKKMYLFTATTKDKKEQLFTGKMARGKLVLTHTDAATSDVHKISLGTLSEGARMNLRHEVQENGKGPFSDLYAMDGSKEGVSFAGGGTKKVCIVTGGLGTMAVSYNGKTYYVCCSGCRTEFNADPKQYVEEFEKNK